jgi:hypothetical protein
VSDPYSEPTFEKLRPNFAELVTQGLQPYHVAEVCGELLQLGLVTSRLDLAEDATEDERETANAHALTAVLAEAVEHPKIRRKARRVLKHVLPLIEEYLGTSIKERRTAASKAIKDGKKSVKPGTIRTYYEPKALDKLTEVLIEMEADHRSKMQPDSEPKAAE